MAHEELHSSLKRVRGECTRVKKKLEESCDKGERLKVIAVEREMVLPFFYVAQTCLSFRPCLCHRLQARSARELQSVVDAHNIERENVQKKVVNPKLF